MQKSFRSFVLVAIVSLAAAPTLHADVMGTNPRPTTRAVASHTFAQTLLSFLGF